MEFVYPKQTEIPATGPVAVRVRLVAVAAAGLRAVGRIQHQLHRLHLLQGVLLSLLNLLQPIPPDVTSAAASLTAVTINVMDNPVTTETATAGEVFPGHMLPVSVPVVPSAVPAAIQTGTV